MKEFKYVVTDPEGIHARPAGMLVKAVKEFSCDIKIAKDGKAMNCKAIFGIMGLAVKQGEEATSKWSVSGIEMGLWRITI